VKYDLVAGSEYADVMIDYIKPNARQGVLEVYQLALADKANCGIIRAKRAEDGTILGSVIIYKAGSKLGGFVPAVADQRIAAGGISSLIISGSAADSKSLIQGLVLLGVRQVKKQGSSVVIMDNVRLLLAPTPGYTDNFRWTLTGRRIVYQELASACCTASKR
jgi:beta-N-acetylhexosaminidase